VANSAHRLLESIWNALDITGAEELVRGTAAGILLRAMLRYDCSIWKWGEHHWDGLLSISMTNYCRVQGVPTHSRPHLMALGILLRRIHDPRRFGEFDSVGLAKKVFGDAAIEEASNRVAETLTKWLANCYFSSHRAYNIVTSCRRVSAGCTGGR